jgi:hypothetical protein
MIEYNMLAYNIYLMLVCSSNWIEIPMRVGRTLDIDGERKGFHGAAKL